MTVPQLMVELDWRNGDQGRLNLRHNHISNVVRWLLESSQNGVAGDLFSNQQGRQDGFQGGLTEDDVGHEKDGNLSSSVSV
jgi:hypothetical protein